MTTSWRSKDEFYATSRLRRRSPEWDFGVDWLEDEDQSVPWQRHRLTWVVLTGELIAVNMPTGSVELLGLVPAEGEYPWPSESSSSGRSWVAFRDAQPITRILEGYEHETHLSWVRRRLEDG